MELLLSVDQRYERTPDGAVWTRMPPAADFFAAHREVFPAVTVLARVRDVERPPARSVRADAPGVVIRAVPGYCGPRGFVQALPTILRSIRAELDRQPVVLLRVPSQLANAVWWVAGGRVDGVELLADPRTLYRPRAVGGKWAALSRGWFDAHVRAQCGSARSAVAVSASLRDRYCPGGGVLLDVELPFPDGVTEPPLRERPRGVHLVSVGGYDYPVKGHDVLIDAVALLPERLRVQAQVTIVGEGALAARLLAQAAARAVRLELTGAVGGPAAVRAYLEQADLFVLASRSEGQPRALLEAMAAGVPAIATAVGGIADLLPASQLAPPEDPVMLAARIAALLDSPADYAAAARHGWERSQEFAASLQRARRRAFLETLIPPARTPWAPVPAVTR